MKSGMSAFLSEAAIKEHKEYLSELKLKASIYAKSGIDIKKVAEGRAVGMNISRGEREEIKKLYDNIRMHEIYFDSFGNSFVPCPKIKQDFGSENNFGYLFEKLAEETNSDFICLYSDRVGKLYFCPDCDLPHGASVHLALDLAEHAYFRDYGFKKGAYIRGALAHFNFGKINLFFKEQKNMSK